MVVAEMNRNEIQTIVEEAYNNRIASHLTPDKRTQLSDLQQNASVAHRLLLALEHTNGDARKVILTPITQLIDLEADRSLYTDDYYTFRDLTRTSLEKIRCTGPELDVRSSRIVDHEEGHLLGFRNAFTNHNLPRTSAKFLYSIGFIENPDSQEVAIVPGFTIINGSIPLLAVLECYLGPNDPSDTDMEIPNTILPKLNPHLRQQIAPTKTTTV